MSDRAAPVRRKKNVILQCFDLFPPIGGARRLRDFRIFLYVCENEGLTVTELADLVQTTVSTCARRASAMAGEIAPDDEDQKLLVIEESLADRRLRLLRLSPRGAALRDAIDRVIVSATTISPSLAAE